MHTQEDLKIRELEKDRSKAAYQEVKARYRQAEERLREICDRCGPCRGYFSRAWNLLHASLFMLYSIRLQFTCRCGITCREFVRAAQHRMHRVNQWIIAGH